jgi:hypothetical protein
MSASWVARIAALCAAFVSAAVLAQAPPRVSFEGAMDASPTHTHAQLSFVTTLPDGYHVNSDAPLDEFLKPTRLLLDMPDGVSLAEIRYPQASLFKTQFSETPLAVYEREFEIGVTLDVAALAPGDYPIRATLKYQACSARICYPPATQTTQMVLAVGMSDK